MDFFRHKFHLLLCIRSDESKIFSNIIFNVKFWPALQLSFFLFHWQIFHLYLHFEHKVEWFLWSLWSQSDAGWIFCVNFFCIEAKWRSFFLPRKSFFVIYSIQKWFISWVKWENLNIEINQSLLKFFVIAQSSFLSVCLSFFPICQCQFQLKIHFLWPFLWAWVSLQTSSFEGDDDGGAGGRGVTTTEEDWTITTRETFSPRTPGVEESWFI